MATSAAAASSASSAATYAANADGRFAGWASTKARQRSPTRLADLRQVSSARSQSRALETWRKIGRASCRERV